MKSDLIKFTTLFFNRLKGYLVNPRENGPELLVSLGLLLAILGILWIIFSWARSRFAGRKSRALQRLHRRAEKKRSAASRAQAPPAERQPPVSPETNRPWRLLLLVAAAAVVMLTLLAAANIVPRYTMGKSSYCNLCHSMRKATKSWRRSGHADQPCQACHEGLGLSGIIATQLQGLSNLSLSSTYWRRHRPLALKTAVTPACLSCHTKIGESVTVFRDTIKVSHRAFIGSKSCEGCHIGHAKKKLKQGLMDICVKCHVETGADIGCPTCHSPAPKKWSGARLSMFVKALITFRACRACHPNDMQCERCHPKPGGPGDDE